PGNALLWDLWRAPAQSERCAYPVGGPLEVRLQEHQVNRQDPLRRQDAADRLEHLECQGVRVLFQRESGCGSSPLEPGDGAATGRIQETAHAPLQWIWRPGGVALRGHGPA